MKLLLDVGNTRTKWWLHGSRFDGAVIRNEEHRLVAEVCECVAVAEISEIRIASVAHSETTQRLVSALRQQFRVPVKQAAVKAHCAGLAAAYKDLEKLGVDRWLAMLAAYDANVGSGCVVLDAGSALTVDFVTPQGRHTGGLIIPGVQAMAKALFTNTRGVAVESLTLPQTWQPGCDTLSCVEQGVAALYRGLLCEIREFCNSSWKKAGVKPAIVVTGGDGEWFLNALGDVAIHEPRLVLKGLLYIDDK